MSFRNWLRESEELDPGRTTEYQPNQLDPGRTTEYMPDNEKGIGIGTIRGLNQILIAMRQIDPTVPDPDPSTYETQPEIRSPDGSVETGFFGTPYYAAPEQWQRSIEHPLDNYERMLLKNIPRLFPQLAEEARKLAKCWAAFRNKVIQQSGFQETQLRPIHYALPLMQMQSVHKALSAIRQAIDTNPDMKTQELAPEFQEIQRLHVELFRKIGPTLKKWLIASRADPASYGIKPEPSANVAEPAA